MLAIKSFDLADLIKKHNIDEADLRFADAAGRWNCVTIPIAAAGERTATAGIPIGSGRVLYPDFETARTDRFRSPEALTLICDTGEPLKSLEAQHDPRRIAARAQAYLQASGIANRASFGVTPAFFVSDPNGTRHDDAQIDVRSQVATTLRSCEIETELHSASTARGHFEMTLRPQSLVTAADDLMWLKYGVKATANRRGLRATFMPKPSAASPGSGMPCRIALTKDGKALFFDASGYAECSQTMLWFVGGLLTHLGSLSAFTAPSTNSYKRLAPGSGAGRFAAFSARNTNAAVRVSRALEFGPIDATANPYLAYSALLLAGLDGVKRRIDPVRAGFGPLDLDIATLPAAERAKFKTVPNTLRDALAALATDTIYLTEGGVFTSAFLNDWIAQKVANEVEPGENLPTPEETERYFDC